MKTLIPGCVFVTNGLFSQAQLCNKGKVVDNLTREPLELAIIKLLDIETSTATTNLAISHYHLLQIALWSRQRLLYHL